MIGASGGGETVGSNGDPVHRLAGLSPCVSGRRLIPCSWPPLTWVAGHFRRIRRPVPKGADCWDSMTVTPAANAARKQRGRPFEPGRSGNPNGKPRGTRHHLTKLADVLADGDVEEIIKVVVEKAKKGDLTAAALVLNRVAPAPRARAVEIDLPPVGQHNGAEAIIKSFAEIVRAVATGAILPAEGIELAGLIDRQRQAIVDLRPAIMDPKPTAAQMARQEQARIESEALNNHMASLLWPPGLPRPKPPAPNGAQS
jgi:hypothetical protein